MRLFNFSQFYRKGGRITSMFSAIARPECRARATVASAPRRVYHGAVKQRTDQSSAKLKSLLARLIDLLLLLLALAATFFCFFAIQELLLTLAATVITHGMGSAVRQRYALITVRNLWLIGGGALLLAVAIAMINYFSARLGQARTRKWLLLILLAELLVIALSRVVAG